MATPLEFSMVDYHFIRFIQDLRGLWLDRSKITHPHKFWAIGSHDFPSPLCQIWIGRTRDETEVARKAQITRIECDMHSNKISLSI
jgi:hypothetical protein